MNPAAVGLAVAIVAAAVGVVGARDGRVARIGLILVLSLAPALAEPLPGPAALAARMTAGLLAVVLLGGPALSRPGGSRLGWPSEALLGLAGMVAGIALGLDLAGLGDTGPDGAAGAAGSIVDRLDATVMALAGGLGVLGLGLRQLFAAGEATRDAMAVVTTVVGIVLVRTGLAGAPGDVEHLAVAALTVAIAAAGSSIAKTMARSPDRSLG